MTAETDLLPLPERFSFMEWETHMRDYARACVSSATEAMRVEVAAQRTRADAMAGEAIKHEARAERLAEALRASRNVIAEMAETRTHSEVLQMIDALCD